VGRAADWRVVEQAHRRVGAIHLRTEVAPALRRSAGFIEDLEHGLIAADEVAVEQTVTQQVDDRLHGSPKAHDAGSQGVAR